MYTVDRMATLAARRRSARISRHRGVRCVDPPPLEQRVDPPTLTSWIRDCLTALQTRPRAHRHQIGRLLAVPASTCAGTAGRGEDQPDLLGVQLGAMPPKGCAALRVQCDRSPSLTVTCDNAISAGHSCL
jgi:hypothetical protein